MQGLEAQGRMQQVVACSCTIQLSQTIRVTWPARMSSGLPGSCSPHAAICAAISACASGQSVGASCTYPRTMNSLTRRSSRSSIDANVDCADKKKRCEVKSASTHERELSRRGGRKTQRVPTTEY